MIKMNLFFTLLFMLYTTMVYTQENTVPQIQTGKASYYSKKFHNRKTASGKIYKKGDMICAHRTYPFGTKLLVRNLNNNKSVVVTVIDRGPFIKGRIIDVSYEAAKQLDLIHHGVAKVEVSLFVDSIAINPPDTVVQILLEDDVLRQTDLKE